MTTRRVQYTQTAVPIGKRLLVQIKSIASSLTLTPPWDTGYGGTNESPWMAKPLSKNFGRQSLAERVDNGAIHLPVDAKMANWSVPRPSPRRRCRCSHRRWRC